MFVGYTENTVYCVQSYTLVKDGLTDHSANECNVMNYRDVINKIFKIENNRGIPSPDYATPVLVQRGAYSGTIGRYPSSRIKKEGKKVEKDGKR